MHESTMRRNRDFIANCRRLMEATSKGKTISVAEVAASAEQAGMNGYYITFDYALRMIRFIKAHPQRSAGIRKLAMWEELRSRVDALMASRGLKERDALTMVLCGKGPSRLYLAESTARRLFHRVRQRPRRPLPGHPESTI